MVTIDADQIGPVQRYRARCDQCAWAGPWSTTRPIWADQPPRPPSVAERAAVRTAVWHLQHTVHR